MKSETVCSVIVEIPGDPTVGIFGETVTISFDSGYVIDNKEEQAYLVQEVKDFLNNLYGENVVVYLFDEHGNEVWIK